MIQRVYKAKRGGRLSDKDAEVIGKHIEDKFADSVVTAKDLVASARPKRSPIHNYFEWDDKKAAEEHRFSQARSILRSIEVEVKRPSGEEVTTRAFHVVSNGEQGYLPERVVWSNPEFASQVVERARRELEDWSKRYKQYEELAGLRMVIDEALAA